MSAALPVMNVEKLGFVDVDGVILRTTDRDEQANQIVSQVTQLLRPYYDLDLESDKRDFQSVEKKVFYHKEVFWYRDAMGRDILFDESTLSDLADFGDCHDLTLLLTSRPEDTRSVTMRRLGELGVDMEKYYLVPKPPAAQRIFTVQWKASTFDTLSMLFDAREVSMIDNEKAILDEVLKHCGDRFDLKCYLSLASFRSGEEYIKQPPPVQ